MIPSLITFDKFTCVSAIGLVLMIETVVDAVAAFGVGFTAPFIAFKGVSSAIWRRHKGVVLDAVPLIGLKLHAIWAAAHSTRCWDREAKVTAMSIGHSVAVAGDG